MTAFRPVNADHAITAVVFVLEFGEAFSQSAVDGLTANTEAEAKLPWIEELPATSKIQAVVVGPTPLGPRPRIHSGTHFAFLRPNGTPMWSLKIAGQEIRVECFQYSRWAKIWEVARKYLADAFTEISKMDKELRLFRLTLQVSDRFVGAPEGYDPRSLLNPRSGRLGTTPFGSGDMWHVHLGWFDVEAWGRTLSNLNVQATGEQGSSLDEPFERAPFDVTIMHLQQSYVLDRPNSLDEVDSIMQSMHQRNRSILLEILSDDALRAIGLQTKAVP